MQSDTGEWRTTFISQRDKFEPLSIVVCNITISAVGFRLSIRAYQMLRHSNGVLPPQKSAFNIILHAHVEFLLLIYCRFNAIISYLMRISLLMNKADLRFNYVCDDGYFS